MAEAYISKKEFYSILGAVLLFLSLSVWQIKQLNDTTIIGLGIGIVGLGLLIRGQFKSAKV